MTEKCKVRKFFFSNILACNINKKNSLTRLFQSFDLDFEWTLSSFQAGILWTPLADTSSLEAAIRNYGKILKN